MKEVEFLPDRIRQQRDRRRRLVRQGYLLGACVVAMGVLAYANGARIARARGELATLEQRAAGLNRRIGMIAPLEDQMSDLAIKKRIDEKLGSRTDCTAVLAELCRVTPKNTALISLEMGAVEVPIERLAAASAVYRNARAGAAATDRPSRRVVRRLRLVITGLAPTDVDVANFIGQLSASCIFEDVNMGYTRTVAFRDRAAREFQVSCYLLR